MRSLIICSCLAFVTACSPKEEQEPDYEHMVMAEDENEWSIGDRKNIVADLPDPQELIIFEAPEQN